MTGGDQIRAAHKHKDFFAYRPQFKVWMLSNHPVNGDPEDDALWGRVKVIEFPHSFLGREDKSKKARLKQPDVLQAILCWAVQGALKWYALGAAGLKTPDAVARTTQAQRDEQDYVKLWLEDSTTPDENAWEPNEELRKSYLTWCKKNQVPYPKGPQTFAQSLKARGYQTGVQKWHEGKNHKGVAGLRLNNPNDPNEPPNDAHETAHGVQNGLRSCMSERANVPNDSNEQHRVSPQGNLDKRDTRNQTLESLGVRKSFDVVERSHPLAEYQARLSRLETILPAHAKFGVVHWMERLSGFPSEFVTPAEYLRRIRDCLASGDPRRINSAVAEIERHLQV
jgi:hypothetical protein